MLCVERERGCWSWQFPPNYRPHSSSVQFICTRAPVLYIGGKLWRGGLVASPGCNLPEDYQEISANSGGSPIITFRHFREVPFISFALMLVLGGCDLSAGVSGRPAGGEANWSSFLLLTDNL